MGTASSSRPDNEVSVMSPSEYGEYVALQVAKSAVAAASSSSSSSSSASGARVAGLMPGRVQVIDNGRGQFTLTSTDAETNPVNIDVDAAAIDDLILTHKVSELLRGQRTVMVPGGLASIFGHDPHRAELFVMKYHFVSAREIVKTFTVNEDVVIKAPANTRIEFVRVVFKGRDFTDEAAALMTGKRDLVLTAGSVESALCGRMIIDASTASTGADAESFVFVYRLHSTPSQTKECLLTEPFFIPPAPSYDAAPPIDIHIPNENDRGLLLPIPEIKFNSENATRAMNEPCFRPEMLSNF